MLSMAHLTPLRASRPVRTMFFDAGNTLLRMNYEVLAEQLRVGIAKCLFEGGVLPSKVTVRAR